MTINYSESTVLFSRGPSKDMATNIYSLSSFLTGATTSPSSPTSVGMNYKGTNSNGFGDRASSATSKVTTPTVSQFSVTTSVRNTTSGFLPPYEGIAANSIRFGFVKFFFVLLFTIF